MYLCLNLCLCFYLCLYSYLHQFVPTKLLVSLAGQAKLEQLSNVFVFEFVLVFVFVFIFASVCSNKIIGSAGLVKPDWSNFQMYLCLCLCLCLYSYLHQFVPTKLLVSLAGQAKLEPLSNRSGLPLKSHPTFCHSLPWN